MLQNEKYYIKDLFALIRIKSGLNSQVSFFSVDSRKVRSQTLFFALKGARCDGHDYIYEAMRAGAVAAVVDKRYSKKVPGIEYICVEDVLQTLQDLARAFLAAFRPIVIGVTGSIGKTTTKDFLYTILSRQRSVKKTLNSENSQVGVPLTILNSGTKREILIIEKGVSQPGEMEILKSIAPVDIGIVTNIFPVHAKGLGSIKQIEREKIRMFDSPFLRLAVVGDRVTKCLPVDVPVISYGRTQLCDVALLKGDKRNDMGVIKNSDIFSLGSIEHLPEQLKENCLPSLYIASYLELNMQQAISDLALLSPPKQRFELIQSRDVLWIDDSYNASEYSTLQSLHTFAHYLSKRRHIAVLASMKELGSYSNLAHSKVATSAVKKNSIVIFIGEDWKEHLEMCEKEKAHVYSVVSVDEAFNYLKAVLKPDDMVLLKGACSWHLRRCIL